MPSLSTNGLLQFIPNGFDYSRSLSNSSPAVNGLETFNMDPQFYAFAGDMMAMNILVEQAGDPTKQLRVKLSDNSNTIAPMPYMAPDPNGPTIPSPSAKMLSCNTVGIAVNFKWATADGGGNIFKESPFFMGGTAVYPGTLVEVTVLTDPFGVYTVQSNTPTSVGGIKSLITGLESWLIGTPEVKIYQLIVSDGTTYNVPFTIGNITSNRPSSQQYIFQTDYEPSGGFPIGVNPEQPANFLGFGLTKGIQGNQITQTGGQIYPNIYFDGIMQNSVWGYIPPQASSVE